MIDNRNPNQHNPGAGQTNPILFPPPPVGSCRGPGCRGWGGPWGGSWGGPWNRPCRGSECGERNRCSGPGCGRDRHPWDDRWR